MTGNSTDGRYSARNSNARSNLEAAEKDTEQSREAVTATLDMIDESLRVLPDSLEILIKRGDKQGVKDLLAINKTACDDALRFRAEKKKIDDRFTRLKQERPKKDRHIADNHAGLWRCGTEYLELNQKVMNVSGPLVEQVTTILDPSAKLPDIEGTAQ